MKYLLTILAFAATCYSQQLVNSFDYVYDTSQVNLTPAVWGGSSLCFAVPNGNSFDIYEYLSGKVASIPVNKQAEIYSVSPYIFKADNQWFLIYNSIDTTGFGSTQKYTYSFKIYRGSNIVLSGASFAYPFYYNGDCYVYSQHIYDQQSGSPSRVWKFGSAPNSSSLTKRAITNRATTSAAMLPSGLQVRVNSTSARYSELSIYDLTGRMVFSGNIAHNHNMTVPLNSLPRTPFVAAIGGISQIKVVNPK